MVYRAESPLHLLEALEHRRQLALERRRQLALERRRQLALERHSRLALRLLFPRRLEALCLHFRELVGHSSLPLLRPQVHRLVLLDRQESQLLQQEVLCLALKQANLCSGHLLELHNLRAFYKPQLHKRLHQRLS